VARDGDLRAIFRRRLPDFDWQSIETGSTGRGIPDSNYCRDGAEGWIEFKAAKAWAVGLRPEQCGWILRRTRHGGRGWIAVRRKDDELWMMWGRWAAELKAHGLRGLQMTPLDDLWMWNGGPARWDWTRIAQLLTR
jgi:hypothetical protein